MVAQPQPQTVQKSNGISGNGFPKDVRRNLEWRAEILRRCKVDLLYRAKTKEMFHRDPLFAFNAFLYTYDPRKRPFHNQPFATWEYEDELILELTEAIKNGEDRLVEKSRDMGITWTVLGVFLWHWLDPRGGADFLVGSRIEDYVDKKGDPRTHFERLRYMFYKLPGWLRPKGYRPRQADNYMKLVNPESGAAITGESNNANFSTQGRYAAILFDEFAKWESTDERAWTAAGDATPCRIPVSTPFGAGGQYYNLVSGGRVKRLRYHWSRHPEKSLGLACEFPPPNEDEKEKLGKDYEPEEVITSPWYQKEKERRTPSEVAQELDIDYLGSGNPVFEGRAWRSLMFYHKKPLKPVALFRINLEEVKLHKVNPTPDLEGLLQIFEWPNPDNQYVTAWDVVEGVEDGDFAVGKVLNRETKDVAATYFSKIDEVGLARVVRLVHQFFTPDSDLASHLGPWTAIETTGPGLATFDVVSAMGMCNLFMAPRYDTVKGGVSFKKGWRTDVSSRNELVAGLREYLTERAGRIDDRLCGELMTFVRSRTGKPQAKSGCHDDEVMAFGIALQVDQIAPYEPRRDKPRLREDGLPENLHDTLAVSKKIKEPSIEELCFMTALEKTNEARASERQFYEEKMEFMGGTLFDAS